MTTTATTIPSTSTINDSIYSFITKPSVSIAATSIVAGVASSFFDAYPLGTFGTILLGSALLGTICTEVSNLPIIAQKIENIPTLKTICSTVTTPEVSAALAGAAISCFYNEPLTSIALTAAEGAILSYSAKKAIEKTSSLSSQLLNLAGLTSSTAVGFMIFNPVVQLINNTSIPSEVLTAAGSFASCYMGGHLISNLAGDSINKITNSPFVQNSIKIASVAACSYVILQTKTTSYPMIARTIEAILLTAIYKLPSSD